MSRRPRVSVCIPTFNQGRYLGAALESVLGQTLEDLEIVVCDDASTDDTAAVVEGLREPRLRYVRNPRTLGIARNRNRCLAEARGEYVAWLDSDDVYLPEMLALQSGVLDRHPDVGLVHGAFEVVGPDGTRLPDWPLPFPRDVVEPGTVAFRELVLCNDVTAPTVLVRREAHERAGPYDERIGRSSTDWDMWLRIALHADVAYTSTPVARYRQHDGSVSTATTRSGERLRCDVAVVERALAAGRKRVPDVDRLERRARAALAAKALLRSRDASLRGDRETALSAAVLARAVRLPVAEEEAQEHGALLRALRQGDEYGAHRASAALLATLHAELEGTRFGERIRKSAAPSPEWRGTLERIAAVVRRVVPPGARIAALDKWDPTLLHLGGREGWHFPDLRRLPDGYPVDGAAAVLHLEEMRRRGAGYLVIPSSAFWWLDFYGELREDLERRGRRVWEDGECLVFELAPAAPSDPGSASALAGSVAS